MTADGVPILMYHSINDRPTPETRQLAVSPAEFADQLAYLRDGGFTTVTAAQLAAEVALPTRPIVITFDDGYADFHTEALPVLDHYGMVATLFVTTGWLSDAGEQAAGRPLDSTLSWGQLDEAAASGIEVAGHSHSHPQLDQIPEGQLRDELVRNKGLLEERLGRAVVTMAYPYGYSDARVRREARLAGYAAACSVDNELVMPGHDRFAVPRLTVGARTNRDRFRRAVHGHGVETVYRRERTLTRGYAVYRRARRLIHRLAERAAPADRDREP